MVANTLLVKGCGLMKLMGRIGDRVVESYYVVETQLPAELLKERKSRRSAMKSGVMAQDHLLVLVQHQRIERTHIGEILDKQTKKLVERRITKTIIVPTSKSIMVRIPEGSPVNYFPVTDSDTRCFVSDVIVNGRLGQLNVYKNGSFGVTYYGGGPH